MLGFVIVALSMVGLANAITTNVLERTREIGILRSIGARARDIRRILTTEGIALALGGWLLGIPLGYALTRLLLWLVWEVVGVRLPVAFPPQNIPIALIGTVALALVVLFLPVSALSGSGQATRSATREQQNFCTGSQEQHKIRGRRARPHLLARGDARDCAPRAPGRSCRSHSLVTSRPSAASRSSRRLVVRSTSAWSEDSILIQYALAPAGWPRSARAVVSGT